MSYTHANEARLSVVGENGAVHHIEVKATPSGYLVDGVLEMKTSSAIAAVESLCTSPVRSPHSVPCVEAYYIVTSACR